MALWCKAHHAWFAGIALLAAVTAELCFGGLLIGRAVPVGGPPPTLPQLLVVLALVIVMVWTPAHPERRIA